MSAAVRTLEPERPSGEPLFHLYAARRAEDRRLLVAALGVAVMIHVAFLFVDLPRPAPPPLPQAPSGPVITPTPLPPPPLEPPRPIQRPSDVRILPVPDPDPEDLEPIREAQAVLPPDEFDADTEFDLTFEPVAPPDLGPQVIVPGMTPPRLIESSRVQPVYPELARVQRIEGDVILQAVIFADGSVGQVHVLRCNRPNLGFEEAAIDAVRQWRYEPAIHFGRPVDVYFTIFVEFRLR